MFGVCLHGIVDVKGATNLAFHAGGDDVRKQILRPDFLLKIDLRESLPIRF